MALLTLALTAGLLVGACSELEALQGQGSPAATAAANPTVAVARASAAPSATPAAAPPAPSSAQPASQPGAQPAQSTRRAAAGEPNPAAAVYAQNAESVVNITSIGLARSPLGPSEQQGTGSGFVFDQQGHIVTNNHVVQDSTQLNVTFKNNVTVPATLIGRDPDNDLAVVKVDPAATDDRGNPISNLLKPVTLGNSDQVVIGTDAIAIGSPLGLAQTVTAGIISAVRSPLEESGSGQVDLLGGAIQTDAPINPGNSGGPLFNAAGEVIGVNSAILSQSGGNIGIGFAIPVNVARRVVPELIQHGCYRHPYVGVSTLSLARVGQAVKQRLGIPPNQNGLLVQEVVAGAARAGLRAGGQAIGVDGAQIRSGGDIIVMIDGHELRSGGDLRGYIENTKRPGDTVTLTYLRDGQRQQATVTLGERPDQQGCR